MHKKKASSIIIQKYHDKWMQLKTLNGITVFGFDGIGIFHEDIISFHNCYLILNIITADIVKKHFW